MQPLLFAALSDRRGLAALMSVQLQAFGFHPRNPAHLVVSG